MQVMMNNKLVAHKDLSDKNMQMLVIKERHDKLEAHMISLRNQLEDERKKTTEIMQMLKEERDSNFTLES